MLSFWLSLQSAYFDDFYVYCFLVEAGKAICQHKNPTSKVYVELLILSTRLVVLCRTFLFASLLLVKLPLS